MNAVMEKRAGRWIAAALLAQMLLGPMVNFVLLQPLTASPGFLVNAARQPANLSLAIMLGIAMAALNPAIAIAAWPVLRRHGEAAALWLFALGVACFVLMAGEYTGWLSMGALSRQHAAAGAAQAAHVAALADVVSAARASAHFFGLMASCALAFVMYFACWRHALVPRLLAALGTFAALAAFAAATMPLLGEPVAVKLMMPLGLSHLALAAWLASKGFRRAED